MIEYAYTTIVNMNFAPAFEMFPVDSDVAFTSRHFPTLEDCADSAYFMSEDISKFLDADITIDTVSKEVGVVEGYDSWTDDELFRIIFMFDGGMIGQTRVFEVQSVNTIH